MILFHQFDANLMPQCVSGGQGGEGAVVFWANKTSWAGMFCKFYMMQIAGVANCKCCKLQVLQIASVAKCKCFKVQVLQSASVAKCKC